jgi:ERCC4-type nuclease
MSIQVSIDTREHDLIDALESDYLKKDCGHIMFDIKQLDIGDILYDYEGQPIALVERKTWADYAASITDKRSKNQALRMKEMKKENPNLIVIYLVEGGKIDKDHKFRNGITRDTIYSSMFNRVVFYNFMVCRSMDINDSCLILTKLHDKLLEMIHEKKLPVKDETTEYLKTIKLAKKDNMTPENCFQCQLAQIPGCSIEFAKVITKHYPSMVSLMTAYGKQTSDRNREQMLIELIIPCVGEKTRRLGPALSKRIYEYLYGIISQSETMIPEVLAQTKLQPVKLQPVKLKQSDPVPLILSPILMKPMTKIALTLKTHP